MSVLDLPLPGCWPRSFSRSAPLCLGLCVFEMERYGSCFAGVWGTHGDMAGSAQPSARHSRLPRVNRWAVASVPTGPCEAQVPTQRTAVSLVGVVAPAGRQLDAASEPLHVCPAAVPGPCPSWGPLGFPAAQHPYLSPRSAPALLQLPQGCAPLCRRPHPQQGEFGVGGVGLGESPGSRPAGGAALAHLCPPAVT